MTYAERVLFDVQYVSELVIGVASGPQRTLRLSPRKNRNTKRTNGYDRYYTEQFHARTFPEHTIPKTTPSGRRGSIFGSLN